MPDSIEPESGWPATRNITPGQDASLRAHTITRSWTNRASGSTLQDAGRTSRATGLFVKDRLGRDKACSPVKVHPVGPLDQPDDFLDDYYPGDTAHFLCWELKWYSSNKALLTSVEKYRNTLRRDGHIAPGFVVIGDEIDGATCTELLRLGAIVYSRASDPDCPSDAQAFEKHLSKSLMHFVHSPDGFWFSPKEEITAVEHAVVPGALRSTFSSPEDPTPEPCHHSPHSASAGDYQKLLESLQSAHWWETEF